MWACHRRQGESPGTARERCASHISQPLGSLAAPRAQHIEVIPYGDAVSLRGPAGPKAPDHLRGRYNAVSAGAFQAGTILGPVVAGVMLNHGWSWAFIAMIVVGCGLMAVLALVVERLVTPAVNGIMSGETTLLADPATGEPVVSEVD